MRFQLSHFASRACLALALSTAAPAAFADAVDATSPEGIFDHAQNLYAEGRYSDAFKDFLRAAVLEHPQAQEMVGMMSLLGSRFYGTQVAYDKDAAQFWLGETYFARGQYKPAAGAFLKGYQTYARSTKAPDSVLKLGLSLDKLGQKDAACASYAELTVKFPNAPGHVKNRADTERRRLGCS